jgi:D-glutamate N-acetyltransferase
VRNAAAKGLASDSLVIRLPSPYLLFLGDVTDPTYAKTAFGLRDWARERCIGELSCGGGTVTTGLPRLTAAEARARGARSLVIGIANEGGRILESWIPSLVSALEAGLDIVSGMHARLEDMPPLKSSAERHGRRLINVRTPPRGIPIGTGAKRSGKRLLTVGTDCALGKKYTALALTRAFRTRGVDTDFRATGQTGIMIAGCGMPMDAVVADFEAGAAELLSPDAAADHWDVIEGQGSLFHPSYAAVSLGLLHGSQPDVIVVCHEPGRRHILGLETFELPTLEETIDLNLTLGRRTNPAIRCAGISFNTSSLSERDARRLMSEEGARLQLPVADPMRDGPEFERLVDACLR